MTSQEKIEKLSKISNEWRCYICGSPYDLDLHHCLHGSYKRLAEEDSLYVALCRSCHSKLHNTGFKDKDLKRDAQNAFIKYHSREEFLIRYGKYFD